jgi:hypothetical protein
MMDERGKLLAELGTLAQMFHGSWVERFSICSRPDCRCHDGERHGPRRYLVINVAGRQRQKYVPNSQVTAVIMGIAQHRRLQAVVDRITEINIELMREGLLDGS